MKKLSRLEFESRTADSRVLSRDKHGVKVLESSDGKIFKLFRLKHSISSARFHPYAKRFAENAEALQLRSIATVKILDLFAVPELARDVVMYEPVQGNTLRDASESDARGCLQKLPAFLAELHGKGIFFRSIHFGNIVVRPDGSFGLIDVADVKIRNGRSLWLWERARNFRHLSKYEADKKTIAAFGEDRLVDAYLAASNLGALGKFIGRKWFLAVLRR